MGNIADQLRQAGLVSDRDVTLAKAEEQLAAETAQPKNKSRFTYEPKDLDKSPNIGHFKHVSCDLLRRDYGHIEVIVKKAHQLFPVDPNKPENKKLHWFVISIREALYGLDRHEHLDFLRLAFRRSNPVVTIRDYRDKKRRYR